MRVRPASATLAALISRMDSPHRFACADKLPEPLWRRFTGPGCAVRAARFASSANACRSSNDSSTVISASIKDSHRAIDV